MSPVAETGSPIHLGLRGWSDNGGQKYDAHGEQVEEKKEPNRGAGNYPDSGVVYGHQPL